MGLLSPAKDGSGALRPYLSPLGAWSFAIGTSIGWGSFVITSNTYLHDAGPIGSVLGMLVGALVMLVVARNYDYLMGRYPDSGGIYAFTKNVFGYDHGFLTAWFVGLTYLAILWANATSVPLFARYFLGDMFQVGYLYTVFGYDVYLGEALLTIAALVTGGAFCICLKRLTGHIMAVLALAFTAAIVICFGVALFGFAGAGNVFDPAFAPNGQALNQVIVIACVSPWAFIGFENISHSTEEFSFPHKRVFSVLAGAVIVTTLLYVFVILLSVMAYPPQFDSWFSYINNLDTLTGIEALPAFYAAYRYLGQAGVALLVIALLALIGTSLIGNMTALSRLAYALAKDDVMPRRLAALNDDGVPYRAIIAIAVFSCVISLFGRTAIGWIVDVTTIGATITYGFVSAAAWREARTSGDAKHAAIGVAGLTATVVIGLVILLPDLFSVSSMATESFFFFMAWSLLGLIVFGVILRRDSERRFGESLVVWIALLAFVMFMSFVWMEQESEDVSSTALIEMQMYYENGGDSSSATAVSGGGEKVYLQGMENVHWLNVRNMLVVIVVLGLAFAVLMNNYSFVRKKERESALQLGVERIRSNTDALTGVKTKHLYAEKEHDLNTRISEGATVQFALAVCDLNRLKEINDTYGHSVGDDYLKSGCMMICRTFQHSPVYRVGGDEFIAVLEGDDYESRHELLEALIEQSYVNAEAGGSVVAAGVSDFDAAKDTSVRSVYERADALMYECKRALKQGR